MLENENETKIKFEIIKKIRHKCDLHHEIEKLHWKQTKINYEVQYQVNPMLEDGIEKKKLSLKL